MKNNLLNRGYIVSILLGIIVFLVVVGGIYIYSNKKVEAPIVVGGDKTNLEITGNKDDLVSFSVKPGDEVSGILNLIGSVKGGYFFEGNIKIFLLDSNQNVLKSGFGTATTEWTTADPVSFTSSIDSTGLNGTGFILIQNDDPSDGEGGVAKKILIPVIFNNTAQKTMNVKLYFPNKIFNPESFDCSLVYPITRIIPYTEAVASATLDELIKGPTKEEEKNGYFGVIPDGTKVNSITMTKGVLLIDFNQIVIGGGGSCGQVAKFNSFMTTLKQFSTVKDVQMTVLGKGNTEDIFQP